MRKQIVYLTNNYNYLRQISYSCFNILQKTLQSRFSYIIFYKFILLLSKD